MERLWEIEKLAGKARYGPVATIIRGDAGFSGNYRRHLKYRLQAPIRYECHDFKRQWA
jgi:hypothetical protein